MEENIITSADAVVDTSAAAGLDESAVLDVAEETVPQKKKRKPINQQKLQDNIWGWVFCIPLLLGTLWFIYVAFVIAVIVSFGSFEISGTTNPSIFAYIANFQPYKEVTTTVDALGIPHATSAVNPVYWYQQIFTRTLQDAGLKASDVDASMSEMGAYLFNTVFYMIGIPIGMVLAVFFAVCMSRDIKGGNLFRVLYYIPCVASTIAIVYTFKTMFSQNGVMNTLFGSNTIKWLSSGGDSTGNMTWQNLGVTSSDGYFATSPFWCQGLLSKCVIVIMSVWKGLGGTIILYVAGLSGVNAATKEAAQIDGANGWQIFWKVTMPDLYPVIFYNIVTSVIGGLQIYAEPVLLFEESHLTSGYVSLVWKYGLQMGPGLAPDAAAGAAYGMFLAVIIFVLTLFQFWLDGRKKD